MLEALTQQLSLYKPKGAGARVSASSKVEVSCAMKSERMRLPSSLEKQNQAEEGRKRL